MRRALAEYEIGGIKTTLPFFREIMEDEEFIEGKLDTGFIGRFNERKKPAEPSQETADMAMIAAALGYSKPVAAQDTTPQPKTSKWAASGRFAAMNNRL